MSLRTITLIAAAIALTGCASGPTAFAPKSSVNSLGFSHQQIEQDRFAVSFTGQTPDEARNYALLRAAELALANGYTHFKVIGGNQIGNPNTRSPISSSVGVGVGSGGFGGTRTNVGVGLGLYDVAQALGNDKFTSNLEVLLQTLPAGQTSQGGNVYNAQSVANSIIPPNRPTFGPPRPNTPNTP